MNAVKVKILEDTFNKSFDLERFNRFTKEFFNELEIFPHRRSTGIWKEYMEHISAYYKIANYTDINDNKLIVLAVEIKKDKSVEHARTMQRNFISKVLDENGYEAAIVAFYNPSELNWRLSFVRLDYSFTDNGLELDLTPARRYSYLVGESEPNHTTKAQLLPIFENDKVNTTIDEIEKAFTVEKVTKEFFEQYKEKYIQLKEYLERDNSFIEETEKLGFEVQKFAEQFSKKLLGQLAFLYFLQKKGWLGVRILPQDRTLLESEFQTIYYQQDDAHRKILDRVFEKVDKTKRKINTKQLVELNEHEAELFSDCFVNTEYEEEWGAGDKRFISKLFQTCQKNQDRNNFFNDFLQPLFYEALNRKRKNDYFNQFNCKVPFLNGGLFEPLEGYHWRDVHFNIPNSLFSNESKKGRDADGILDIFERYNFTINEDEPLEKEVAVDPEMLGKIFENLLDVKDRKSKGAFYTPREIVHYMCQESLANYLSNEIGVPYEDAKEFILYGDLIRDTDSRSGVGYNKELSIKPSIYNNLVKIDRALENVKVADPAVGSGAFPLGMLSEIVRARNNITDYLVILDKKGRLGRDFGENIIRKSRSSFKLKWHTIKNSIFAVDIEPSAVDIAKLRLWLSVVVDQEINNETPEPQPLPNLDMNIMVGNSLIEEYEGIKLFDESVLKRKQNFVKEDSSEDVAITEQLSLLVDYSDDMLQEMFKLQDQYFGERIEQNKKEIKQRIDKLRDELIEYKLERDGNKAGLEKYKELKKKKQKPYFLWHLEFAKVFQEKSGFDIVIGNPPYVGQKGNKKLFDSIKTTEKWREFYERKQDLYYYFIALGIDLSNKKGSISYIIPPYFITADGAKNLRKKISSDANLKMILNLSEKVKVFEGANINSLVLFLDKNVQLKNEKILIIEPKEDFQLDSSFLYKCIEYKSRFSTNELDESEWFVFKNQSTLEISFENTVLLGDIANITPGIQTGCDKVSTTHINNYQLSEDRYRKNEGIFVLTKQEMKSINFNDEELQYIKPFYKNSDVSKWLYSKNQPRYIIVTNKIDDISKFPNIEKHLLKYKIILDNRYRNFALKNADKSGKWWYLYGYRPNTDFDGEKIVNPNRSLENRFAYSNEPFYSAMDIFYTIIKDNRFSTKYILAILNSKLMLYWLNNNCKKKGKMLELIAAPLSKIPIKIIDRNEQRKFEDIVDVIVQSEINNQKMIQEYQEKLDGMIYSLYGLSSEEIDEVESNFQ